MMDLGILLIIVAVGLAALFVIGIAAIVLWLFGIVLWEFAKTPIGQFIFGVIFLFLAGVSLVIYSLYTSHH